MIIFVKLPIKYNIGESIRIGWSIYTVFFRIGNYHILLKNFCEFLKFA